MELSRPVAPTSGRATPDLRSAPPAKVVVATGQGGCRSTAEYLDKGNGGFEKLQERYAGRHFGKSFAELGERERIKVWEAIIESAGRDRSWVTKGAKIAGDAGKGLWALTAAIAAYEILTAEDWRRAAVEQGGTVGGGVLGGTLGAMATGALLGGKLGLTGFATGPGGIITTAGGVLLGGIVGALAGEALAEEVAEAIFGPDDQH